jgi:dienelactone hydrolase
VLALLLYVHYHLDINPVPAKLALCLLPMFSVAATAAQQPLIPIEHFVERDTFTQPRLSPDGKHIAVNERMNRNGRMIPTMSIFSLPELKRISTIALPAFEIPVNFVWLNNRRLLVKKGREQGWRVEPVATGEVVAVNLDGTQPQYLYGFKAFEQSSMGERYGNDYGYGIINHIPASRDGRFLLQTHLWDARSTSLYDVDGISAARKLVAQIPMKHVDFTVQTDGKPRFAVGFNDSNEYVQFRRDDASGEWRKVVIGEPRAQFYPLTFTPDDKAVYVSHSHNGGPHAISREDLATGVRTLLASDPFADLNNNIQYTARPRVPFAASTRIGIPKTHYFDATLPDAQLHKSLSGTFADAVVSFINFSDDGQRLLFVVNSDRDPGSYYLFDRKTGVASVLFTNKEKLAAEQMAERRPIQFAARDGLVLTGYLTLPNNPGKQQLPMVLLPHGGPFGVTDDWFFDTDAQFLASRGYAVLQVNFRGSGERGPDFREAGYKQWGGKMIDDLADGVKWANKLPEIDPGRVCAYGASFGAYASMMLAVREPAMFKCAVGYAGLYHLPSVYTQDSASGDAQSKNYFIQTMGDDRALLEKQSPTMLADQIKLPVMLVHGGNDKTTQLDQAQLMRSNLTRTGNAPEWILEKDEGHGFYDAERRKAFYERLEIFLGKHIGKKLL